MDDQKSLRKIIDLDLLIHTPARLAILIFLLPRIQATFPDMLEALQLTSGNLSSHIKKLSVGELVEVEKIFIGDKPTTKINITPQGRQAVLEYASILNSALDKIE